MTHQINGEIPADGNVAGQVPADGNVAGEIPADGNVAGEIPADGNGAGEVPVDGNDAGPVPADSNGGNLVFEAASPEIPNPYAGISDNELAFSALVDMLTLPVAEQLIADRKAAGLQPAAALTLPPAAIQSPAVSQPPTQPVAAAVTNSSAANDVQSPAVPEAPSSRPTPAPRRRFYPPQEAAQTPFVPDLNATPFDDWGMLPTDETVPLDVYPSGSNIQPSTSYSGTPMRRTSAVGPVVAEFNQPGFGFNASSHRGGFNTSHRPGRYTSAVRPSFNTSAAPPGFNTSAAPLGFNTSAARPGFNTSAGGFTNRQGFNPSRGGGNAGSGRPYEPLRLQFTLAPLNAHEHNPRSGRYDTYLLRRCPVQAQHFGSASPDARIRKLELFPDYAFVIDTAHNRQRVLIDSFQAHLRRVKAADGLSITSMCTNHHPYTAANGWTDFLKPVKDFAFDGSLTFELVRKLVPRLPETLEKFTFLPHGHDLRMPVADIINMIPQNVQTLALDSLPFPDDDLLTTVAGLPVKNPSYNRLLLVGRRFPAEIAANPFFTHLEALTSQGATISLFSSSSPNDANSTFMDNWDFTRAQRHRRPHGALYDLYQYNGRRRYMVGFMVQAPAEMPEEYNEDYP